MHTGDGGYIDAEGFVFLVDRLKDMIISGGENRIYKVHKCKYANDMHIHRNLRVPCVDRR